MAGDCDSIDRLIRSCSHADRPMRNGQIHREQILRASAIMFIGAWLRQLREQRGLSQADMEKASGLLRGYISRVENGRTVPCLETLERLSAALDVPLYGLFYMNGD